MYSAITKESGSHNGTVKNLRLLLKHAGINEREFVEKVNEILMEHYTDIDIKNRKSFT